MTRQNVTLSLPKSLLKKAKLIAAKNEKSLSELLKESLEEKINNFTGYNNARERHLKILETQLNLGTNGSISISRDKLHERN